MWGESNGDQWIPIAKCWPMDSHRKVPVMQSFYILFVVEQAVEKYFSCQWSEMPWCSCDVTESIPGLLMPRLLASPAINSHEWYQCWWISPVYNQNHQYLDGLVQERCNSNANALELHLFCTNPSIWETLNLTRHLSFIQTIQHITA